MLILGTLVVTWIARNWWKILLLLTAVIILREYQVHKHKKEDVVVIEDRPDNDSQNRDLYIPPPFGRESKADKDIIEK